jgi:hypothetical protein
MSPTSTPRGPKAVDPITALEADIGVVRLSQRQGSRHEGGSAAPGEEMIRIAITVRAYRAIKAAALS